MKAIEEGGHKIVAHTWNHRIPERLSQQEQQAFENRTVSTLSSIVDQREILVDTGNLNPEEALINRENWKGEPFEWVVDQIRKDANARGHLVLSDLNENSPRLLRELLPNLKD